MKKSIHIIKQKKQKKVYVTVLLFILYSIWVHVESPKYKMICLKSPKSSEFATRCAKKTAENAFKDVNFYNIKIKDACYVLTIRDVYRSKFSFISIQCFNINLR